MLYLCILKNHQSSCDDGSSGGGCLIPLNSTTESLDYLGATIFFIDFWLKALEQNFMTRYSLYGFNMNKLFQKISVELPKQRGPKEKRRSLLHTIGGGWYVSKLGHKLTPLKKSKLSKKSQKEEDEINRRLTEDNQYWYYCKFQVHCNKLEWVNPRSRDERNNPFCVSSKKKN